jgi:lipopolysaccharide transport system ATP-binding protein
MSDTVISVENLSKRYLIGHESAQRQNYTALRDVIARETRNFVRKASDLFHGRQIVQGDETEEIWALRNVSFEVKQGEVVGIIGRNGAGKSTLLKILSRITEPSEGRVRLRGRVGSLLEVGTGFHPELTGRENIYLNGAILGMTHAEIRRKFDEIVAFAEVEKFLDTPVKRYSSGMYVRLAFAVAAHLEPEILIVDEVLAVGDAEFQRKCLGRMSDVASHGRTVLFVSHNVGMITSLCSSAIWLDQGLIRDRGAIRTVVGQYLAKGISSQERVVRLSKYQTADAQIYLESLEWLSNIPLQHGQPLKARICFTTRAPLSDIAIGIGFSGLEGKRLLTYETDFPDGVRPSIVKPGLYWADVEVESLPLGPDIYNLDIGCRSGDFYSVAYLPACVQLEIVAGPNTPGSIVRKDSGVRLASKWSWNVQTKEECRVQ